MNARLSACLPFTNRPILTVTQAANGFCLACRRTGEILLREALANIIMETDWIECWLGIISTRRVVSVRHCLGDL